MKFIRTLIFIFPAILLSVGCKSTADHAKQMPVNQATSTTVGTVQKEIRQGMTQAEVAEVLGSPNIVTSEGQDKETWIYDKISTETAYSTSSGGVSALVFSAKLKSFLLGGGASGNYQESTGVTSTTQKTLTVIIYFVGGKVNDFKYHSSKF